MIFRNEASNNGGCPAVAAEETLHVSIILPTYNEGRNISELLAEIHTAMTDAHIQYECIFVDDSTDDTGQLILWEAVTYKHVRLIKRQGAEAETGLTMAFRRGFQEARSDTIVCMDTDLQHPPAKIVDLVRALDNPQVDIAVCSRYADGGSAEGLDGFYRRLVSKASTYLTFLLLPNTRRTSDPMTGFFAFRKEVLDRVVFSSHGFKILVELLASMSDPRVLDIPFIFRKRGNESSKASLSQGVKFFKDIFRIFIATDAGNISVKCISTAVIVATTYFLLSLIQLLAAPINATVVALLAFIPSSLLLFSWALKPYHYEKKTVLNTVLVCAFIALVFWLFAVSKTNAIGFAGAATNALLAGISYLVIFFVFKPIWTKDSKASKSTERWFLYFSLFLMLIIAQYFLRFYSSWYVLLFVVYLCIIVQGIFALYLMMYAWENEDNIKSGHLTNKTIEPKYSFTAIIPCKHEKATIADTLLAMRAINYPQQLMQVLVVIHEGSDDGTIDIVNKTLKTLSSDHMRLVTYTETPVNKPHGLNEALQSAIGDYVVIFDAEDEVHPDLFKVINTFLVGNNFDVVQSGVQLMNYESSWYSMFNILEYYFWFKSSLHFYAKHGVAPLGGVGVFFKREFLHQIGGWNENCLTEDADIGIKLSQAGAKIGVVYDAVYAIQEETPPTLWSFIKQRTRWAQGFLQILARKEYVRFPTLQQRCLSLYVLAWPIILPVLFLFFPIGLIFMFTVKLPPLIALIANISLFMFLIFTVTLIIGFHEFTKEYKKPFLWSRVPILLFLFYPYTLLLVFASVRAMHRHLMQINSWEKTEHLNKHRVKTESFGEISAY